MPFLHNHKRRVSPQNVYRCIVIGIHAVPAMATDKRRLVLTIFFPSTVPHSEQVCDV